MATVEEEVILSHVKVGVHGEIKAKVRDLVAPGDHDDYEDLLLELNKLMKDEQMASNFPYNPDEKELCAGLVEDIWYRVRVEHVLSRMNGPCAMCYLVDEGEEKFIPVSRLRHLPAKFGSLPHQVHTICLHGIQPLSLVTSPEDLMVHPRVRKKWDKAAVKYISERIKDTSLIRGTILYKCSDGALSVRMFLRTSSGGFLSLNDTLVEQGYAINIEDEESGFASEEAPISVEDKIREKCRKEREEVRLQLAAAEFDPHPVGCHGNVQKEVSDDHERWINVKTSSFTERKSPISIDQMLEKEKHPPVVFESEDEMKHSNSKARQNSRRQSSQDDYLRERLYSNSSMHSTCSVPSKRTEVVRHSGYQSMDEKLSSRILGRSMMNPEQCDDLLETDQGFENRADLKPFKSNVNSGVPDDSDGQEISMDCSQINKIDKGSRVLGQGSYISSNSIQLQYLSDSGIISSNRPKGRGLVSSLGVGGEPLQGSGRGLFVGRGFRSPVGSFSSHSDSGDSKGRLRERISGSYSDGVIAKGCSKIFQIHNVGRGMSNFDIDLSKVPSARGTVSAETITAQGETVHNYHFSKSTKAVHDPSKSACDQFSNDVEQPSLREACGNAMSIASNPLQDHSHSQRAFSDSETLRRNLSGPRNISRGKALLGNSKQVFSSHSIDITVNRPIVSLGQTSLSNQLLLPDVVSASMKGQLAFTKARIPLETGKLKPASSAGSSSRLPESYTSTFSSSSGKGATKSAILTQTSSPMTTPEPMVANISLKNKIPSDAIQTQTSFSTVLLPAKDMELEKSKIFGQMQGQKILEKLGHGIEKNKSAMLQNLDQVSTKFQTTDHVLIHGGPRPRPSITIHGSRFNPDIITAFEQYGFAAPTIVQAYSWPIVRKGRHLVMISPSGTGKTLAYLYPLLDYLSVPERYREIRKNGMGAFVIILTLTWENAEKVHYEITKHEECTKGLTTLLVHGGGMEEKKLCELINGCDILISTPPCLKRIIMKKCTNLRRLCHLVLDDADQLLERFRKEISFLIEDYNMVISSEMEQYSCPRQILAFSSHWNHSIEEFMKNALNEPVLVITSHSEAAIYGKVKHVPHMCRHDNRLQTVVNIVENLPGANNSSNSSKHVKEKTIIFSSSKSDLFLVFHALKSLSHYCMMVHPDMDLDQALQVAQQTNLPLLVCTDKYVSEMRISDATCIIHFDIPNSKTEFSNRLGCMRDYFQDFSRPKKHPVQTVSHLIMTEECRNQARNLNELLVRSNSPQSMELQDFMAGIIQAREENEGRDLCNQVLAYGTCRDKWRCKFRHIVVPEVDIEPNSDWIPNEGEVKVLVTHIIDASHYYARILGVRRREGGQLEDMSARFSDLQLSLGQWFSKLTNQKRHTTPFIGEVCGYQENNIFFRVQILDLMDMNCHEKGAATMEAKVRFVDIGREAVVEAFKLYELPEHLKSVPHQAVEVFVGRVKPVDKDIKWTHTASKFAHEELHRKELEGKIVLCVGYRLWLDPLVLRFRLTETRVFVNKFAVHTALIKKGLADENRNHLERLFRLVEGKVHIPKSLMVKTKMSQQLITDVLPACKPTHQVIISAVRSPELFFVQRLEKMDDLETLMTEIGDYVEYQAEHDSLQEVTVGKIYLAQYTEFDQRWYRGRVVNVENACVEIFFADYGDSDTVPLDKIRAMPVDKFYELPLQAIECKLANVEPNGPDPWHDKVGNAIWEMSHFVNERDSRPLTARVIDSQNSVAAYMGDKKFALDITCGQSNIGEELVWRQLAKPALNSTAFQPLLSKPSLVYRMYKSMLHKIPDLCSALYWEQHIATDSNLKEPSKAMKIADEILGILGKHLPSLTTSQEPTAVEGARFLTKLVGRLGWANVHSVILDCVLYCVRAADSLCTVLLEEGLVKLTVSCLEMNSEQVFQHQAADFIAKACSISSRLRSCYVDMHMDVLYELLDSTSCEHVQGGVCRAFTSLCSGPDDRAFVFLMSPGRGTIQRIVGILSRSTDHLVAESVLSLISTLTEIESNEDQRRNHDDLKKESLIEAIVKNLRKTDCDKCIQYSVQLCDHFASKHRKRKRFLIEQEMVPILNGLLDLQLQSSTRQLCRDLKTSLEVRVPSEPMRAFNRPDTQPKQAATNNVITPEVRWSQNSFVVRLVIKVSDADDGSSDVVQFSDDTVTLRVATNTGNFGFSYKLYDKICISKCKVAVRSQDLLVSMTKEKKGMWSRLIHDKVKMPNVLLDCDNIVDSSDSEECNEDEPFKLTKGKKQKSFSCGLARKTMSIPDPQDSETDTTDSLEILEDHDRTEYDFDDIAYQNL